MFGGLGGNLLDDAAYFWLSKDTDGNPLTGENKYVIRFTADQIPQVKAFWYLQTCRWNGTSVTATTA